MDAEIKKLADSRDLKSLKYIFVDSLDVDPTFVRYEEEYNYCKSIPGLLESHQELTPFIKNKSLWNEAYWTNLKMDLVKNFSDLRMTHMREVAKVFLAEKMQRILAERSITNETPKVETVTSTIKPVTKTTSTSAQTQSEVPAKPRLSKAEEQEIELRKEKERLAKAHKAEEERIKADNARRLQQRYQNQTAQNGTESKKIPGIAIAAVTVIVVAAIVVAAILLLE